MSIEITNPDRNGNTFSVGDGVTFRIHTDCSAYTVTEVSPKRMTLRLDDQKLLNAPNSGEPDALKCDVGGFAAHVSGKQRWSYTPNPEGPVLKVSLRKTGEWVQAGHPTNSPGCRLTRKPGRHAHQDFNY